MTAAQSGLDSDAAARSLDDAHRQLLGDGSIQFELPTGASGQQGAPQTPPPSHTPPPSQSAPPPNAPIDQSSGPPVQASGPEPISGSSGLEGVMQVFLWVAAGVALAILLYWLFTFFRDRSFGGGEGKARKGRETAEREAWRPAEGEAVQLLDEADVLANQGRFDEAARLLLHRSIGEIDAHRPDLVRPALTSRDIARHPLLPSGPASAFARIAALVERSLFARRPLGAEDWQDCRAAYRDFAFAEGWRG